mmetsp:Transcript_16183/g.20751  ORF Transcript_16183/g.20751 Transcript_16183/m.20751 type:complete len:94 (+) Transcript_16183:1635-1916(+)
MAKNWQSSFSRFQINVRQRTESAPTSAGVYLYEMLTSHIIGVGTSSQVSASTTSAIRTGISIGSRARSKDLKTKEASSSSGFYIQVRARVGSP